MSKESAFGMECPGCGLTVTFRAHHQQHCEGYQEIEQSKGWTTNERLDGKKKADHRGSKRSRRKNNSIDE